MVIDPAILLRDPDHEYRRGLREGAEVKDEALDAAFREGAEKMMYLAVTLAHESRFMDDARGTIESHIARAIRALPLPERER